MLVGKKGHAGTGFGQTARRTIIVHFKCGYAISSDEVVPRGAIGAPISSHDGTVSAAISITGLQPSVLRDNQSANVQLVVEAAAEVSRANGYRALDAVAARPLPPG